MQNFERLNPQQIANLRVALAHWHGARGNKLLGSQLGQIIREEIQPLTIRNCGGLKVIVQHDLSELISRLPDNDPSDKLYSILVPPINVAPASPLPNYFDDDREVFGIELWRLFSNPRLTAKLTVDANGKLTAAQAESALTSGKKIVKKLTEDDYRLLATDFSSKWVDDAARNKMQSALSNQEDFYNNWIAALRQSRTRESNPLKVWEVTRTEYVARRLGEELVASGVDRARAAEIVATARPNSSNAPRSRSAAELSSVNPPKRFDKSVHVEVNIEDDTRRLRELLHIAIDRMPVSDLKNISIPAGLLLEVSRKYRD